ncbi:hypothetical protein EVAR_25816_1 [Eumeta japonica]|uniref:Uncharacterized protein n=1 Tax=Eumeta variegata TaxID=151549 RepID=A0A4C1VUJ1_EUMVA|nr:hypothetical protein EVAR_25816_1 [Eumeta japonica]
MSSLLLFGLGSGLSGRRWRLRLPVRILSVQCSFEPHYVVSGSARVYVYGVPRSVSHATAVKPRASVPTTHFGDPAICTPSPHTVSAPRERSRSFHTPDTDRYFSYFVCLHAGFLVRDSRTHPVRPSARTDHNGFLRLLALRTGRNTKKKALEV